MNNQDNQVKAFNVTVIEWVLIVRVVVGITVDFMTSILHKEHNAGQFNVY